MSDHHDNELGYVTAVSGARCTVRLHKREDGDEHDRVTIGRLVAVHTGTAEVIGVVSRVTVQSPPPSEPGGSIVIDIDFLGEIKAHGTPKAFFQRGVSEYPTIGDTTGFLGSADLALIHHIGEGQVIEVGKLKLDASVPAFINFEELLRKHFAVLGTTGVGKSTSVALILQEILKVKASLRIFLFDPHNEYAHCFGELAYVVSPKNLQLPFWLFNFEEIVDVFFRGRPGVEEETEILSELIPIAKAQFAANARADRIQLRKASSNGYTADTPVPYRISDLVALINDRMGKLENRQSWTKYNRLIQRIESLGHDSRYTFMFNNLFVEDMMVRVLGDLFRMPTHGRPITVMQLAGFPAEVVDSVVSVMCRMAFDFGVWSDGAAPLLVVCEESHRYAPADRKLGFGPTRKAISRIAKEGRKYGVFLGAITQRPADLDPTILSQCSTVFAMRMANERDQAIVRSAVPDAGASLIELLASLGTREAVAFGEGVALPMRFRFADMAADRLPRSQSGWQVRLDADGQIDRDFMEAVVERWREASTTNSRPKGGLASLDEALEVNAGLGAPLIPRRAG
ncbi:MAG: ATP-binding protein [Rhizobiales bacterium]|nr:ATP-binding protein [Hyphomicrobiales bacterium]